MGTYDEKRDLSGIGDILKGFGKLIGSVVDMVDKGIEKKSVEGDLFKEGDNHALHGKYGFSVKLGLDEKNAKHLECKPEIVIPPMDLIKDDTEVTLILEMPGVSIKDIRYVKEDHFLCIEAMNENIIYKQKADLEGFPFELENIRIAENNGIFKMTIDII